MEKVATDIYSFHELREKGFTYVDKTALLLPLCDMSIGKQFFLARPRRFGKVVRKLGISFSSEQRTIVDAKSA